MIEIPPSFDRILSGAPDVSAAVKKTVVDFDAWISRNSLVFFPEYTDHGPIHISSVLATAEQLITEESLPILTPQDAGALVVASVLHDCAMHLTNDGFRRRVSGATELAPVNALGDKPWPELWEAYLAEAARFSPADNNRLFGEPSPVKPPSLDDWNWDKKQDLLAGEFIRRHHHRLAHQIALHGFPGSDKEILRLDSGLGGNTSDVIGLIARSHGMELRPCLEYLANTHFTRIDPKRIRALFLMVVLRIADYLQIEAGRAPVTRIRMQAIRSTDDLDQILDRRGHRFCRYADDRNIYVRSLAAGQRVMESVTRFLEGKLKLRVNREKSAVAAVGERKFLGHRLLWNGKLGIAPKSIKRAKEKVRQITRRNRGVSLAQVIVELNLFLVGWIRFYRYAACRFELQGLDAWIRRKLRCYRLKQCKRGKAVARLLQRLGAKPSPAPPVASSAGSWWRLSRTRSVQQAMSVEWFETQGLVSLAVKYDSLRH